MKHNNTKRGFRHARRALEQAWLSIKDPETREVLSEELSDRFADYAAHKGARLSHFGSMFANNRR